MKFSTENQLIVLRKGILMIGNPGNIIHMHQAARLDVIFRFSQQMNYDNFLITSINKTVQYIVRQLN